MCHQIVQRNESDTFEKHVTLWIKIWNEKTIKNFKNWIIALHWFRTAKANQIKEISVVKNTQKPKT